MTKRTSLRSELLFNLAFLAAAALLLALVAASALQRTGLSFVVVAVVVIVALLAFILLGNHLLERLVLLPLEGLAESATSISAGQTSERLSEEGPTEIVAVATAFNHLTDHLLQNQERLAENVRSLDETNQRLTETQFELVQAEKMASIGQLAAGIAHEIGNPLGALLGYVSLQKRRGGDGEILEGMERETRRIDRIVRELLDYARPGNTTREEVEVNASAARVVTLLRDQGWLANVTVDLDLDPTAPPVLGDTHRIDQIFVNLLRNAETAMDGHGSISIRTFVEKHNSGRSVPIRRADDPPGVNYAHLRRGSARAGNVTRDIGRDRDVVRVTVTDSGPGISEDMIGSIFDPFFTTKGPGEGIGLGLAIVAGSVADLGGRIEVASEPGQGASFNLWLPAVQQEE